VKTQKILRTWGEKDRCSAPGESVRVDDEQNYASGELIMES